MQKELETLEQFIDRINAEVNSIVGQIHMAMLQILAAALTIIVSRDNQHQEGGQK